MTDPVRFVDHPVLGPVAFDRSLFCWQTRSPVPLGDTGEVAVALTATIVLSLDPDLHIVDIKLAG